MASNRHQFIVGLLVKRMREDGIVIHALDGKYPGLFGNSMPLPPRIINHRPDIVGSSVNGQICIGEAKTESDISNSRTYEQLQDFLVMELNGLICKVYLGIPKSSEVVFTKTLSRLGLSTCNNLVLLLVPDIIINA